LGKFLKRHKNRDKDIEANRNKERKKMMERNIGT
jgi:hypothetical protein